MSSRDSSLARRLKRRQPLYPRSPRSEASTPGAVLFASLLENFVNTNPATAHLGKEGKTGAYNSILDDLAGQNIIPNRILDSAKDSGSATRAHVHDRLEDLLKRKVKAVEEDGIIHEDDRGTFMTTLVITEICVHDCLGLVIDEDNVRVLPSLFETDIFAPIPVPHLIPGTSISVNSGLATRYAKDYKQLEFLGKGGFGSVWKCRHTLDGQLYAVKQVHLNKALKRFIKGKSKQVEEKVHNKILKEIRTLAALDHCNVVRYYNSWLEAMPIEEHKIQNAREGATSEGESTGSESETHIHSIEETGGSKSVYRKTNLDVSALSDIFQVQTLDDEDVEQSKEDIEFADASDSAIDPSEEEEEEEEEEVDQTQSEQFKQKQKRSFTAHGSEDYEGSLIRRTSSKNVPSSSKTIALPEKFAYILYLQMSLHPLSLLDYIGPPNTNDPNYIRHTFHPVVSIGLLLKIMDGVEYLHKSKLVHRDLKPANIFLTVENEQLGSPGGLQAGGCHCSKLEEKLCISPDVEQCACLMGVTRWIVPKIRDFGLVTDLVLSGNADSLDSSATGSKNTKVLMPSPVGTVFYRPPTENISEDTLDKSSQPLKDTERYRACEKIDVYALGIILFELLYKTNTERASLLNRLQRTSLPKDMQRPTFSFGKRTGALIDIILKMTAPRRDDRYTMLEARTMLENLLE